MNDLRGLQAALDLGALTPAELYTEIQRLSRLAFEPEPNQYLGVCRNCGDDFWTARKPTGTKWTQLCTSCLYDEV